MTGTRDEQRLKYWEQVKSEDQDGLKGVLKDNSKLILEFLSDFEVGLNTPRSKRGARSPATLLKFRHQLVFFDKHFKKKFTTITKQEANNLIKKMQEGKILKKNKQKYSGCSEFVKNIKTFNQWLIKTGKTKNNFTEDLTSLDQEKKRKPDWVFLEEQQRKMLVDNANGFYRPLIILALDSGARPQELMRFRVFDFQDDYTLLNIPKYRSNGDKVSKTFERKIKLMFCKDMIKQYVQTQGLKPNDLLVNVSLEAFNKYLRTLSKKLFGINPTKARGSPDKMTLYDLRHNASCYWATRYKKNSELMYRMGWTNEGMVNYYHEFLGIRDTIGEDDLYTTEDKTNFEKQINGQQKMIDELKTELGSWKQLYQRRKEQDQGFDKELETEVNALHQNLAILNKTIPLLQNKIHRLEQKSLRKPV